MNKKHRHTIIITWIALGAYIVSLFFPYQIIISRWGDNDVYPPEPQYVTDTVLPLLCLVLNIPLFLRLIQKDLKKSVSWTFLLAVGLLSLSVITTFLLSPFVSGWYLTTTKTGIGVYLNLASALLFLYATLSKPVSEDKTIKNDLFDRND